MSHSATYTGGITPNKQPSENGARVEDVTEMLRYRTPQRSLRFCTWNKNSPIILFFNLLYKHLI